METQHSMKQIRWKNECIVLTSSFTSPFICLFFFLSDC